MAPAGRPSPSQIVENLPKVIRKAKEYAYRVENLCHDTDLKERIVKWSKATSSDVATIKDEVDKAYQKCLARAKSGPVDSAGKPRVLALNVLRELPKLLSGERWRFLSSRKVRDEETSRVYLTHGWDSHYPVGPSKIASKLNDQNGIDAWIFLAKEFANAVLERYGSRPDVALISTKTLNVSGGLFADDPLLLEIVGALRAFLEKPNMHLTPSRMVDTFVLSAVVRIFQEYFNIADCGHLKLDRPIGDVGLSRWNQQTLEQRLLKAGSFYLSEVKDSEVPKLYQQLEQSKELVMAKLDELPSSEWVVTFVKRNMAGNLIPNEVLFLCKSCGEGFGDLYELPNEPPVGGLEFVFRGFVNKIAEELNASAEFVELYDICVIRTDEANIAIMRHPPLQPMGNLALFKPSAVIMVCNFFRGRWRGEGWEDRTYGAVDWRRRTVQIDLSARNKGDLEDPKVSVFSAVSKYLLPSLAYDCETDTHESMEISLVAPALGEMVSKIASIEFTVKPTEKAFKAAHDQLVDLYQTMGLSFGFDVHAEYPFGPDRVDVTWLDRLSARVEVAIEVELGSNPSGELWKLGEIRPKLAVLVVKGNQYDQMLTRVSRSVILREMTLTLMIIDVSDRRYTLIRGTSLLEASQDSAMK